MDIAYNQHSQHARRNNKSSTNLSHLSLAPLTSRLPLNDSELLPESSFQPRAPHEHRISYLEGKSAPTTPGVLSRSSSRVSLRKPVRSEGLAKSKSSANITNGRQQTLKSGLTTPGGRLKHQSGKDDLGLSSLTAADRNDSDWLLRAGALIATGTRESKGQAWLVSRASSTSLTGQGDDDEEVLERALARERESRRGSAGGGFGDADDEFSPITTRMSFGGGSRPISRYGSRPTSRIHSRRGSKANLASPILNTAKEKQGYFDGEEQFLAEPDFVDVDEDVDYGAQGTHDEVVVRRLAKTGSLGLGVWVEKLMGWSLFAVEEDGEDSDPETNGDRTDTSEGVPRTRSELKHKQDALGDSPVDENLPPPADEEGGWQDAAWLLSVASKVLL